MPLTIPNILTLLRIAVIPIVVVAFFSNSIFGQWLAVLTFFVACVSDFFDGYLARLLSQSSHMGQMLDPIADKLLVMSTLFLLAAFGPLKGPLMIPGLIIICREVFISGVREFLGNHQVVLPVSSLAKWKTMLQMLALGGLLMPPVPFFGTWPIYLGGVLLWAAAGVTLVTGMDYFFHLLRSLKRL